MSRTFLNLCVDKEKNFSMRAVPMPLFFQKKEQCDTIEKAISDLQQIKQIMNDNGIDLHRAINVLNRRKEKNNC